MLPEILAEQRTEAWLQLKLDGEDTPIRLCDFQ